MLTSALIITFASLSGLSATEFDQSHSKFDGVLARYVRDGLVDYAALKEDRAELDAYLDTTGAVSVADFQRWSHDQQLAYLLNVYNATTLQLIIDNYPLDSIKSIGSLISGPWDKKVVNLFGKSISLNTLEHKIIRERYTEPRIHFSLVCAALGCPPLRSEAYRGDHLELQLQEQAEAFFGTPEKNRVDHEARTLHLSPIFKWYRKDFEVDSGTLVAYVGPYLTGPGTPDELQDFEVDFTDYDWSLNEQVGSEQ